MKHAIFSSLFLTTTVFSFNSNASNVAEKIFPKRDSVIESAGDVGQFLPTLTALAITGYKKDKEGFKQLGLTVASTMIVTEIGKKAFNNVNIDGRPLGERPNGNMNNFPSGHTSFAFSGAWYIKKRYGWKYAVAPIAIATFTGFSRMYAHKHDMKGVVSGALTGILFAEFFTKQFDTNKNLQVSFNSNGYNAFQFNASYSF